MTDDSSRMDAPRRETLRGARHQHLMTLVAAIAVASLITACAGQFRDDGAEATEGGRVGFSPGADILWMSRPDQARELDEIATTGARWVRLDVPWPSLQPTPSTWNWEPFDRVVSAARARKLKVLGLLSSAPRWARRSAGPGRAPFDTAAFATYSREVARHFAVRGVHDWEVWNEPNVESTWIARPDPEAYTVALKAASRAIKAVDRRAVVLSGGLSPATDAGDGSEVVPSTFLARVYAAGGGRAIDGVAVHPYSFPALPTDPLTRSWNAFLRMAAIRRTMVAAGDGRKEVWLTELGAPTGTGHGAVTEAAQARYVTAAFAAWNARRWAGPMMWYSVRDAGSDRSSVEDNFGLLRRDFSAKPAYGAFTRALGQ
jgi:hypothetical protein